MNFQLSNTADDLLLRNLAALAARDRATTAALIAHIAEVDWRRLYAGAGHQSMYWYCVRELRMSEDAACRRIDVARAAREFPAILPAIASGDLTLSSALLLAKHLNAENAAGLLAAAAGKTRREVEQLLAERFPQADLVASVTPLTPAAPLAPASALGLSAPARIGVMELSREAMPISTPAAASAPHPRVTPLAPERFGVQFTASARAHEQLRYAQALLGHAVPSGDIAQVFARALDALVEKLEREKFAKTSRTRASRGSDDPRHVPAAVRRAVFERDHGQCTFVAPNGHRCDARTRLEFDHVTPVARGGVASAANLRLRCRAHNQFEAERAFGTGFIQRKREQAMEQGAARCVDADAGLKAAAAAEAQSELIPWLRRLGFSAAEARRGATRCTDIPDAPLEERLKAALRSLAPASARTTMPASGAP